MTSLDRSISRVLRRPLSLAYHPLYRFYQGGGLAREFRGLEDTEDSFWSEDWVGSLTTAGNPDPNGEPQGLTSVEVPDVGPVTLQEILRSHPEELIGPEFAARWGLTTGVLVKILSPGGPVPLHAHPDRVDANRYLNSRWGKTEAWIMLHCPGDGTEPAYAGMGFKPDVTHDSLREMVERQDTSELRSSVHRFDLNPGEVWVAHGGVPHLLGPRVLFIEVQEPSDHLILPEHAGTNEEEATMGLGWDVALDMLVVDGSPRDATLDRARQEPVVRRHTSGGREVGLMGDDVRYSFFDASQLEVSGEIEVTDGRFYIGVVTEGSGELVGDFDPTPVRRGDTFCCAASLNHGLRCSGSEQVTVVRCMGPAQVSDQVVEMESAGFDQRDIIHD